MAKLKFSEPAGISQNIGGTDIQGRFTRGANCDIGVSPGVVEFSKKQDLQSHWVGSLMDHFIGR